MAEVETKPAETEVVKTTDQIPPKETETAAPAVDKKEDARLAYRMRQTEQERDAALQERDAALEELASRPKGDEDVATLKKQNLALSKRAVEVEAISKKQSLENAALNYAAKYGVDITKLAGLSSEAEIRAVAAELKLAEAEAEAATPGDIDLGRKGKTTSSSWEEIKKNYVEHPNDPDAMRAYGEEARKRGLLRI